MKHSVLGPTAKDLYDLDFFEWTVRNAELLRSGRLQEADLDHIAEEIEDMGKTGRRELYNRVRVLLSHLLKWKFQPDHRSRSWKATIDVQRNVVALLEEMPSLRRNLRGQLSKIYPVAVKGAIAETELPDEIFPPACPFTFDQIVEADFFPE